MGRGTSLSLSFSSELPMLETCFYYTRACNLHCFSEKSSAATGTGSFSQTWTGTLLEQREPPALLGAKARGCWEGREGAGGWGAPCSAAGWVLCHVPWAPRGVGWRVAGGPSMPGG